MDESRPVRDESESQVTLRLRQERHFIRASGSRLHIDVELRAEPPVHPSGPERLPVALALVVDRSGSMAGDKLGMAKRAVLGVLELLKERDQVAVVVYDDCIDVLQPAAPATAQVKATIRQALEKVDARATTALHQGWLTGCHAIASDAPGAVERLARCFLLTDGLANVGETDPERIAADAAGIREHARISTSTFGIGADYDEGLLGPMAVAGGGQFHHLRSERDILSTFTGELGDMLAVAAAQVRLELDIPPELSVDVVSDYWMGQAAPGRISIAVGDLLGGEQRHIVVRFAFPPQADRGGWPVRGRLVWSAGGAEHSTGWEEVHFAYADDAACDAEVRDASVMHWVGLHHAERAKRQAAELSRKGDLAGTRRTLHSAARHIAQYAGDDADLRAALSSLQELQCLADRPADALFAKEVRYQSQRRSRGQRDYRDSDD